MRIKILILGITGRLGESLQTLINAVPQVELVEGVSVGASPSVIRKNPDLVIMGFSTPGQDLCALLGVIRAEWPAARCLVLVDNVRQKREALALGVEAVLLKGFSAPEFFAMIKGLAGKNAGAANWVFPETEWNASGGSGANEWFGAHLYSLVF